MFGDEFIAFDSDRGNGVAVYTMYDDGTDQLRTVAGNTVASDAQPSWAPSGEYLVFHRTPVGNVEVFTMDYSGSEEVNISENEAEGDSSPDWEPYDSYVYCGGERVPTD